MLLQCRLQAISAALLLAGLAIGYLAAITSALRNEAWFVCHHEHIKLALEVAAAFTLFWWMLVLHPSQLTPTQTPFNIMVFRGYGMILDRVGCCHLQTNTASSHAYPDVITSTLCSRRHWRVPMPSESERNTSLQRCTRFACANVPLAVRQIIRRLLSNCWHQTGGVAYDGGHVCWQDAMDG